MTVTYTAEVATCRGFGCFLKLLARWRGSIYKLVWLDLLVFLLTYYSLNFTYLYWLDPSGQVVFDKIVMYCYKYSNLIPLSFVLGFYVTIVMTRWWNQYSAMPWPDPIAVFVSAHIHGQDERGRVMRRTVMRYVCLCLTMVFTMISPKVKKRFPTLNHLVEAGLLVENEKQIMDDLNKKFPTHSKHWLPIVWASSIVTRARKEGRIRDDFAVKTLIDELNKFRGQAGTLLNYDVISIPLVYTQVVTLAVYSYFITSAIGRQGAPNVEEKNSIDIYFPVIFTTLEFFFYMGWLKVAESLINPWGDDDDDFEVNWLVDRNIQVSYIIVDEMHHEHPQLVKDQYWDEMFPQELPYTLASEPFRETHPLPSTANIEVPPESAETFTPSSFKIDEMGNYQNYDDGQSGIHFFAEPLSRSQSRRASRPPSVGSQSSMGTLMGSMPRVNSVSGVLRRLFSREDSRTDGTSSAATRLPGSASSASLRDRQAMTGSMRIADQIIEEVDEQLTITSMRNNEPRPTVMNLFGPPPASTPVDVPSPANKDISHISNSAPAATEIKDTISIGGSSTNSESDEFSRLKMERDLERRERLIQKLARSVSMQNQMEEGRAVAENIALLTSQPSQVSITKNSNV